MPGLAAHSKSEIISRLARRRYRQLWYQLRGRWISTPTGTVLYQRKSILGGGT